VVAIGYVLLLPALPALPLSGTALVYSCWAIRQSRADAIGLMRDAGVPEALVQRVQRGENLWREERAALTLRQLLAYELASDHYGTMPGLGVLEALVMSALALVAALVATWVGAVLVRKELVLRCERCEAA
jgi:hypothetical protein